jgi:hypothetical protein
MGSALTEKDKILQKEVEHDIQSLGTGEWVVVYRHAKTGNLAESLSCALRGEAFLALGCAIITCS